MEQDFLGYSDEPISAIAEHLLQDPKFGFDPNEKWTEDELDRLVFIATDKLENDTDPLFGSIRMQVDFDRVYKTSQAIHNSFERQIELKIRPLVHEICESHPRVKNNADYIQDKLAQTIFLSSGLGSPSAPATLREIKIILQSVFPLQNVKVFVNQSLANKKLQVKELQLLVTGIRIFNWDCQTGGVPLEDVPASATRESDKLLDDMGAMKLYAVSKACEFTALGEVIFFGEAGSKISDKEAYDTKFGTALLRQFIVFLNILLEDAKTSHNRINHLDRDLVYHLNLLRKSLAHQETVSTFKVFPQFMELARIWTNFRKELKVIRYLQHATARIHRESRCLRHILVKAMLTRCSITSIPTDEERCPTDNLEVSTRKFKECQYTPRNGHDGTVIAPRELSGFCPVALAISNGMLMPANPNLGLIQYQGKYYEFSSVQRAQQFGRNPDVVMEAVHRILTNFPLLQKLFGPTSPSQTPGPSSPLASSKEVSIQTPVHFHHSLKDPTYEWNEWTMRMQAIQWIKMRTRRHQTAQAGQSAFRRERGTQSSISLEDQDKQDSSANEATQTD
ncbi:hypothetical protein TCAL_00433 [Tigriopus californicus]|uniref:Cilia- and flagella-associated protein 206 n=1 Tax=Tigriopus californicus TaxID=6832 RepID=A0A553NDU6_TIGCA|nr:cilia- and flagella-associated protein 206-like [Tigriopus californicus]TRY63607.1 hypothetical protein TCAL_00433 [Tigriopus californicus]